MARSPRFAVLLAFVTLALVGSPLVAGAAPETTFLAKIFEMGSSKKNLLFTYQHDDEMKGDVRVATNTYKAADGSVAAIETTEFAKDGAGEKLVSYKMSQKQLGAEGALEVKGGKAKFTYTKDGKTKTSEENAGEDFVAGPSIVAHLQKHWDTITKGESVKVRFAVLDRAETVGFQFFKDREETIDGQKTFVLKMKPTSFIIAALVNPLYFFMTPDGKRLVEVRGRVQVKQKVDGVYKDLDGETTFDYSVASAAPAAGNSK